MTKTKFIGWLYFIAMTIDLGWIWYEPSNLRLILRKWTFFVNGQIGKLQKYEMNFWLIKMELGFFRYEKLTKFDPKGQNFAILISNIY